MRRVPTTATPCSRAVSIASAVAARAATKPEPLPASTTCVVGVREVISIGAGTVRPPLAMRSQ